jgi:predicted RNA-binding Zn-ribbon protein involved in translation (DUF1610 family)
MEIYHRVSFNADTKPEFFSLVNLLEIKKSISPLPGNKIGGITFEIAESDSHWQLIKQAIEMYGAFDFTGTVFTPEEILSSERNRLIPIHEWGYPQPEKKMQWKQLTYRDQCPNCGVGHTQISPFLITKEPKLGNFDFFTLIWTYTLFCKKEVLEIFREENINGYDEWNPIIRSLKQPSSIASQLFVSSISKPGLAESEKVSQVTCPICGIIRYKGIRRGKMLYKRESLSKDKDLQLTHEWFGTGNYWGVREFIVSNRLSRLILTQNWKGVVLQPIELI